jgi:hypothetical protein
VRELYVHVKRGNSAARQLYLERCGFALEQEESDAAAMALKRPPRLLLRRTL